MASLDDGRALPTRRPSDPRTSGDLPPDAIRDVNYFEVVTIPFTATAVSHIELPSPAAPKDEEERPPETPSPLLPTIPKLPLPVLEAADKYLMRQHAHTAREPLRSHAPRWWTIPPNIESAADRFDRRHFLLSARASELLHTIESDSTNLRNDRRFERALVRCALSLELQTAATARVVPASLIWRRVRARSDPCDCASPKPYHTL